MPLPELNLGIKGYQNPLGLNKDTMGEERVVVRNDSSLHRHCIKITISDTEVGTAKIQIDDAIIEIPTYKLTLTDDKTEEISVYEVTRDVLQFSEKKVKKSFWSFLGIRFFDTQHLLYENIAFEPQKDTLKKFTLHRYRSKSENTLTYDFYHNEQHLFLFAGALPAIKTSNSDYHFMVIDKAQGQKFIGDISYREKMLKLTPKVELTLVQRTKVAKKFEYSNNGKLEKRIYL